MISLYNFVAFPGLAGDLGKPFSLDIQLSHSSRHELGSIQLRSSDPTHTPPERDIGPQGSKASLTSQCRRAEDRPEDVTGIVDIEGNSESDNPQPAIKMVVNQQTQPEEKHKEILGDAGSGMKEPVDER